MKSDAALAALIVIVTILAGCTAGDTPADGSDGTSDSGDRPQDALPAGFLQQGYDAGRTGNVPGDVPTEYEIAFSAQLPGARVWGGWPMILDRQAYVLVQAFDAAVHHADPPAGLTTNGLVRVGLDTGKVAPEPVVALDAPPLAAASDGDAFYIAEADRLAAYTLDGRERWAWDYPDPPWTGAAEPDTDCAPPAVHEASLYLACTHLADDGAAVIGDPPQQSTGLLFGSWAFAARLDLSNETGGDRAVWTRPAADGGSPSLVTDGGPDGDCADAAWGHKAAGVTVAGPDRVILTLSSEPATHGEPKAFGFAIHALDTDDGATRWTVCQNQYEDYAKRAAGEDVTNVPPQIVSDGSLVYLLVDHLIALEAETGADTWEEEIGSASIENGGQPGEMGAQSLHAGLALRPGRPVGLFVHAFNEAFRMDTHDADPETAWSVTHNPTGTGAGGRPYPPLVGDGGFFIPDLDALRALDTRTGAERWTHQWPRPQTVEDPSFPGSELTGGRTPAIALADGVLVLVEADGRLTAFGRTEQSIQPMIEISDRWPAPGDPVTVNLTGTEPGAAGGPLEYRADWGDGTKTAWQDAPDFEHTYTSAAENGPLTARFAVRAVDESGNATQRSVEVVAFDVGGTPPAPPRDLNWIQERFEPDNQETTFFLLGLLVTLVGTAIGVARYRQRSTRLQRELQAIDEAYALTKERPHECEAMLTQRKVRARGLLVDDKLTDAQFIVVEKRIEELLSAVRMNHLDERFDYLPHGMVKTLQKMLADGRVSRWERDSFLAQVDGDKQLTKTQKKKVRDLIDEWFRVDEGRAPGTDLPKGKA